MTVALKFLGVDPPQGVGPQGGNLNNPRQQPEARRSSFQPQEGRGEASNNLPGLHRFRDSAIAGYQNEQPWHRMAAFMLLAGRTNSEIAVAAEVTPTCVSNLRQQRWFQELLAVLANEQGEDILGVMRSEALASIEKLVSLRDFSTSERVAADVSKFIIEQVHGKAVQKVISSVSHSVHATPQEEMNAIEEELRALREKNPTSK